MVMDWGVYGLPHYSAPYNPRDHILKPYSIFSKELNFLKLPAEIRNKIYDFAIPNRRVRISGNRPKKELVEWKDTHEALRGPRPRYCHSSKTINTDDPQWSPSTVNLLKTCKQINKEALAFLIGKTTFIFDSSKTLRKFLDFNPAHCRTSITSIEMYKSCYGEVDLTKNTQWKQRADKGWRELCERLGRDLPSLKYLYLDIQIADWPTQLKTDAPWARSLLKIVEKRKIHRVDIDLGHFMFADNRLMMTAESLEDMMMTEEGKEERSKEIALAAVREFQRKEAERARIPVKATKSLVIKLSPSATAADQKTNRQKTKIASGPQSKAKVKQVYTKTRGLEGYHRVDLATVGIAFLDP